MVQTRHSQLLSFKVMKSSKSFTFVDLFAGIGGFHAVLGGFGGECVYAVEIDAQASSVYKRNWGIDPQGDITTDVTDEEVKVPPHDVLVAGFPCQPFSKSGAQRGMDETRGTLYWSILRVIREHHPPFVLLENVRNLAGPRHRHEWEVIVETLRREGYWVPSEPTIFSPHLLPRERGGRPQSRERVFITAILNGTSESDQPLIRNRPLGDWKVENWKLISGLPMQRVKSLPGTELSDTEILWIDAWNDFVENMWEIRDGRRLPGFPLWGDSWVSPAELIVPEGTPKWKIEYLEKNANFYEDHKSFIDSWAQKWGFYTEKFPPSRRKLEWQAQDTPRLWDTIMHFRPSGIRAKRATYVPTLVAITQTTVVGPRRRRLSPKEAARLQGLPDWFDFGDQADSATFRQLGNGVSIGAVWHVFRETVLHHENVFAESCPGLLQAVLTTSSNPDDVLTQLKSLKK